MDNNSKNTNNKKPFVKLPCDSIYALYRTMRETEITKCSRDPDAESTASGIILISNENELGAYTMAAAAFGANENILTTLTLFVINKLKEDVGEDKLKRMACLKEYLKYFTDLAKDILFEED